MLFFRLTLWLFPLFLFSCKKQKTISECEKPAYSPFQPYFFPVWHPNGNLLGFNHLPLSGVSTNGVAPCIWYMNTPKPDSAGFYLMNKDGTGFKRATKFYLIAPSWSPDGNWIAFSYQNNIYKMPFDGNTFDTTQMVLLTNNVAFNPTWTFNNDTIYFESPTIPYSDPGTYSIWKMANDGSSKTMVKTSSNQPYIGSDNKIYFVTKVSAQPEIFSMHKDGSATTQITFNGKNGSRRTPKYYQNNVLFWDSTLINTPVIGYSPQELAKSVDHYDISKNGEIVYTTDEYGITDNRYRTLWIINADGTNKRQVTFNHY